MRTRDLLSLFATALSAASTLTACASSSATCADEPSVTTTVPVASVAALEADAGLLGDSGAPKVGEVLHTCDSLCPDHRTNCEITSVSGNQATLSCHYDCTGRVPAGYCPPDAPQAATLGAHFARMAALEAASIVAFRSLARELATHRAPVSLVRACRRAARDEVRHARATSALARAHGATVLVGRVEAQGPRSIEAMALENAVEGCVRETFGALVAHWQAREARDPRVRAAMKRIARDETRHAALSWSIDAWARTRIDRVARARIDQARTGAVRALATTGAREPLPPFADAAGLPSIAAQRALVETLFGLATAA